MALVVTHLVPAAAVAVVVTLLLTTPLVQAKDTRFGIERKSRGLNHPDHQCLVGTLMSNGTRCDGIVHILPNCSVCCVSIPEGSCKIGGQYYDDGTEFDQNCMKFKCDKGKWKSLNKYNAQCGKCYFYNDPHFKTFDNKKFDYHGLNSYIISQKGCKDCSETFVASEFKECSKGSGATCIKSVYFQPQKGTLIKIEKEGTGSITYAKVKEIIIDDNKQNLDGVPDGEIIVLKGEGDKEHPAFAWKIRNCIHIMGFKNTGYLVKICDGADTFVFAHPTMQGKLCGLCGNYNKDVSDDITLHNGNECKSIGNRITSFCGEDWNLESMENCPGLSNKIPRNRMKITKINDDADPCKASPDKRIEYKERCQKLNHQNELFVDDCAFDQCIAEQSDDENLPRVWLKASQDMLIEVDQQKKETIAYGCEAPYKSLGCIHIVQQKKSWNDARNYCQQQGGDLAILDSKAKRIDMINYLEELKSKKTIYWLGAKHDTGSWVWLNNSPSTDGWYHGKPSANNGDSCMYLSTAVPHTNYNVLDVTDCPNDLYFICQK